MVCSQKKVAVATHITANGPSDGGGGDDETPVDFDILSGACARDANAVDVDGEDFFEGTCEKDADAADMLPYMAVCKVPAPTTTDSKMCERCGKKAAIICSRGRDPRALVR